MSNAATRHTSNPIFPLVDHCGLALWCPIAMTIAHPTNPARESTRPKAMSEPTSFDKVLMPGIAVLFGVTFTPLATSLAVTSCAITTAPLFGLTFSFDAFRLRLGPLSRRDEYRRDRRRRNSCTAGR